MWAKSCYTFYSKSRLETFFEEVFWKLLVCHQKITWVLDTKLLISNYVINQSFCNWSQMKEDINGYIEVQKIIALLHEIPRKLRIYRFFCNGYTLKLYKILTIGVISKIWSSTGPLAYPSSFLFNASCYKTNNLQMTASNLKVVRGGESALAMAKRRYNTVLSVC